MDHDCDYGCSVAIGTCADGDNDHACDYGCSKSYGDHVDSDKNHVCDYGCPNEIAKDQHVDTNLDHICDYGCVERIGQCVDNNQNHVCDYGENSENGCRVSYGSHEAAEGTHTCDYCGEPVSTCTDAGNLSKTEQVNATCASTGTKEYWTCSVCAKNYSDAEAENEITDLAAWKADENGGLIPATGEHTYSEKYTTENGRHWLACTNPDCSAKTNDAECTDGEDNDHNCDTCGAENVSGHSYAYVNNNDGTHDYTCSVCGDVQKDDEPHDYGEAHKCACGAVEMFTITFNTDGGTAVEAITGNYGAAVQAPEDPTRVGYTFVGWDKEIPSNIPAENMTITAQWTINTYTVKWENEDGNVLETDENVEHGTVPTYDGATPTKAATAQYTYTFNGWTPEVSAVTGDMTYKATYTQTTNTYTVTWKHEDGTVLKTDENVLFGATPNYDGKTPTKQAEGCTSYTFKGWDNEPASVNGDVTYTAKFEANTVHNYDQKNTDDEYLAAAATCKAEATYYYSCVCGQKGTETFKHGKLQEHDWNPEISYVAEPKTDEHGCEYYEFKASRNCVNCNATEETTAETIGELRPDEGQEPTCSNEGVGSCEVTFKEEWAETYEFPNLTIPKDSNNHENIQEVDGTAPTCTANGKTDKIYCATCETVLADHKEIAMIDHGIKEVVYAGGNIPVKNQNIAALKASSFIQEMTVQDLMDKVNYCVNEAAKNSLLGTFANFYGSEKFQSFVQEIVGKDTKDLTDTQKSNATVLYVAQKLSKADTGELRAFLETNTKYDTISHNENIGEKIVQAALTYGMYCAYESCGMEWETVNLDMIVDCIEDSDGEGFLHYLEIQGERDLAGFLAAMETINSAVENNKSLDNGIFAGTTGDLNEELDSVLGNENSESSPVETLLNKGFNDPDLVKLIQNEITDYSHYCSCGEKLTDCILETVPGKDATCTETGLTDGSICILCGTETQGEVIGKKSHELSKTEAVEATCTTPGNSEYWTCKTCGKFFGDETGSNEIKKDSWITTNAHTSEHVEAKEATCYQDGNNEYWTCETCDKFFSNEECTMEIAKETVTIPATGVHIWGEATIDKAPTCTEPGQKTSKCTNDGCDASHTEAIEKTAHTPGEPVFEGTTAIVSCKDCGAEISRNELLNPFSSPTMELNSKLTFCFIVKFNNSQNSNFLDPNEEYIARVTRTEYDGKTVTQDIPSSEWTAYKSTSSGVPRKKISFNNMAAKQMTDILSVVIYNSKNEPVTIAYESSVRKYAMTQIKSIEGNANYVDLMAVLVDMLNYGAAAQTQFNYNKEDLANNELTASQKAYGSPDDVTASDLRVKGTGYSTTTLSLENNLVMNLVFFKDALGGNVQDLTATITYTHHYAPNNVQTLTITGSEFKSYKNSSTGRERFLIEIDCLDFPDGDQLVTCEIRNSAGEVLSTTTETVNGFLSRNVTPTVPVYLEALKFTTSAYQYFKTQA